MCVNKIWENSISYLVEFLFYTVSFLKLISGLLYNMQMFCVLKSICFRTKEKENRIKKNMYTHNVINIYVYHF